MTAPQTALQAATPNPSLFNKHFDELVDFDRIYKGLAERGIQFTEAERTRFEAMSHDTMRKYDGSALVTNDLGTSFMGLVQRLFYFLRNALNFGDVTDAPRFASHLTNVQHGSDELNKLKMLEDAAHEMYFEMYRAGGNLAKAAPLVTGIAMKKAPLQDMDASILRQVHASINLPWGTSSLLAAPPQLLPRQQVPTDSKPLTRG